MGYFSNNTDGDSYTGYYCDRCKHNRIDVPCPVLDAHFTWNYDECNNKDSILHKLIPRNVEGCSNGECICFSEGTAREFEKEPPKLLDLSDFEAGEVE